MPKRRVRRPRALTATALVAFLVGTGGLLGACSNNSSAVNKRPVSGTGTASPVNGVQTITITTGTDLRFHPSTIVVHPGKVRLILKNTAKPGEGPPHNIVSAQLPGLSVPTTQAGASAETEFTAPAPGRYRFDCSIHVNQGQIGYLIVKG